MAEKLMCDFCGTIMEAVPSRRATIAIPQLEDGEVKYFGLYPDLCDGCAGAFGAEIKTVIKALTTKENHG